MGVVPTTPPSSRRGRGDLHIADAPPLAAEGRLSSGAVDRAAGQGDGAQATEAVAAAEGAEAAEAAAAARTVGGEGAEGAEGAEGLLTKLLKVLMAEPPKSTFRFWLASCVEVRQRGG